MGKSWRELPILDREALYKLTGFQLGNQSLIQALSKSFQESASLSLEEIHRSVKKQNGTELRQAAHRLKSTSSTLGLERISALCREIEAYEAVPAHIEITLKELENEIAAAKKELFESNKE